MLVSRLEPTMTRIAITIILAAIICFQVDAPARDAHQTDPADFRVRPIGHMKRIYDRTLIVLERQFQPGLLGLEGFSHILVFWWFDRNDTPENRSVLQVHPRGNPQNPLTGVFATRSPRRPNLIALTLCKVVAVKDNIVEIDNTDAFDGTPVLDIKPFLPGYDTAEDARVPDWAKAR
jgi:tRNA-Thr(GGU) m(6)t(6)A37 methyltransferase TsaA